MKKFLRENPTIAFGLGLPLLLVVVFLLISGIPTLLVAPPQYDVLYATNYNHQPNGVQIAVVNRSVQVNYLGSALNYQNPRLWRYSPKTGAVRELAIMLPPGLAPAGQAVGKPQEPLTVTSINVPDLTGVTVDSSSHAPDGYQFSTAADAYSRHVFTGLFYSGQYRDQVALTKDGRSIRLPHTGDMYYGNYARFVGWVVAP